MKYVYLPLLNGLTTMGVVESFNLSIVTDCSKGDTSIVYNGSEDEVAYGIHCLNSTSGGGWTTGRHTTYDIFSEGGSCRTNSTTGYSVQEFGCEMYQH